VRRSEELFDRQEQLELPHGYDPHVLNLIESDTQIIVSGTTFTASPRHDAIDFLIGHVGVAQFRGRLGQFSSPNSLLQAINTLTQEDELIGVKRCGDGENILNTAHATKSK
jgi:hypothetical protein